jgi:hypothetical protein
MLLEGRGMESWKQPWLGAAHETAQSYRRMIDAAVGQLTDQELNPARMIFDKKS